MEETFDWGSRAWKNFPNIFSHRSFTDLDEKAKMATQKNDEIVMFFGYGYGYYPK